MATDEQKAKADEIRAGVKHDDTTYLKRLSDDMSAIRKDLGEVIGYMKRAESRIPEDFRRLCMSFHDVHDVRNAYTESGIVVPAFLDRVIELLNDAFKHACQDLEAPGGAFYKSRQDIVKRGDFRYDHNTPLLAADKAKEPKE